MKKKIGTLVALILVLAAVVAATTRNEHDPIVFTAYAEADLTLHIENYSDATLVVNHITIITSNGIRTTQKNIRVTNGSLYVHAPLTWRAGEEVVVMVGCTYGKVSFVRQVTKFL